MMQQPRSGLIGLAEILDVLDLAVWSNALQYETNPVSVLLLAIPESGKTEAIMMHSNNPYCVVVNDITAYGLITDVLAPLAAKPTLLQRVILIPDLLVPLSRAQDVSNQLISTLASFMEEGIQKVTTFNMNIALKRPVAGGIITSMTPEFFKDRRRSWNHSGFTSRFLVISYKYGLATQKAIAERIWDARHNAGYGYGQERLRVPTEPVAVDFKGPMFSLLELTVEKYLRDMGIAEESYGLRYRKHMRRLALAAALRRGSETLGREDIERVEYLVGRYANLRYEEAM